MGINGKSRMIEPSRIIGTLLFLISLVGIASHPSAFSAADRPYEVRAGILRNYAPDQYLDPRTGNPAGLAVDLMDQVAKNAGLNVRYVLFEELSPALQALRDGHIDILSGVGITEERKKDMDFTRPFDTFNLRIFVRESTTDIRGIDDLRGRNVAVVVDSSGFFVVKNYGKVKPVVFRSLDEALLSLLTGNTEALVSVEPPVRLIARKAGLAERIEIVGEPLREIKRAIAVSRKRADLLPRLDAAVQSVMASPKFKEMYVNWYSAPEPYWNVRRMSIAAGLVLVLIIVAFAVWHFHSLRRINRGLKRALEKLKNTDALLRGSETRYRQIIEASHNMVWETDANAVCTYISPRVKDLLGYEPGEVIGRFLFDFMSDEQARRFKPMFAALAAEQKPFMDVESVNRHKDGRSVTLETTGVPVVDDDGVFRGYRGINRDITERKRAEEKLNMTLQQLKFHVENSPLAVVEFDKEYRITRWSNRAEEVFGWRAEEVTGKRVNEFRWIYEEDAQQFAKVMDEMIASRCTSNTSTNRNYRKDGSVITCEWYNSALIDPSGELVSTQSLVLDINKRKQAEEDRLRLATAIDQSGEMVIVTDREGTIQSVNPAFERITGYSREEIIGQNPRILKSGGQDALDYRELWDTLTAGRTWKGRLVNRRKDGSLFDEEATISPIRDLSGEITHYVAVKRDITEKLKTERMLSQAQRMEAVGTLAGGIAHDFKNILGAISGFAEMSLMKIPGDSRIRHYLEQIHTASRRAIDLVGQILAFSRQSQTEQAAISLTPLVKETVRMLRETIPAAIEIKLNVRTETDTVLGNAAELYQIIRHLCTNAYQAMKDRSGLLEVELARMEVGEGADIDDRLRGLKPGSYLEMAVRDTGEGIDPIILGRIFDPFFTTKKIGEGTGLGLSMVHGIVTRYGGKITVESRVGAGSAFHVYLPLLAKTPEAASREPGRQGLEGRGRILLVDDEATVAGATKVRLEESGYTVTMRTDGIEALETFRAHPDLFDLVMTDRAMPGMMGVDLAENILSIRPGIPVILCAGFINATFEEETAKAGIRAVVLKPINMGKLIPLLRNLLASAS